MENVTLKENILLLKTEIEKLKSINLETNNSCRCKNNKEIISSIMNKIKSFQTEIINLKEINKSLEIEKKEREKFYERVHNQLDLLNTNTIKKNNIESFCINQNICKNRDQIIRNTNYLTTSETRNTTNHILEENVHLNLPNAEKKERPSIVKVRYEKTPIKPIVYRKETFIVNIYLFKYNQHI